MANNGQQWLSSLKRGQQSYTKQIEWDLLLLKMMVFQLQNRYEKESAILNRVNSLLSHTIYTSWKRVTVAASCHMTNKSKCRISAI